MNFRTCFLLLVNLSYWLYLLLIALLFVLLLVKFPELPQTSATFVLTAVFGTQLGWVLLLAGLFMVLWRKGTILTVRYLSKIMMVVWLIAAPIIYSKQECLDNLMVKIFWVLESVLCTSVLGWQVLWMCCRQSAASNQILVDEKTLNESSERAKGLL